MKLRTAESGNFFCCSLFYKTLLNKRIYDKIIFSKNKGEIFMKIKIENLYRIQDKDAKLAGVATIVLNDSIKINTIKIVRFKGNLYVVMPSVKVKEEYRDVIYPTTTELRNQITDAVLNAYKYDIFENGTMEEFHVSDVKIFKVNHEKCKAILNITLNDNIVIARSYFVDNGTNPDGSLNLGLVFQSNKDAVPFVSILTDNLKGEVLKSTLKAYQTII